MATGYAYGIFSAFAAPTKDTAVAGISDLRSFVNTLPASSFYPNSVIKYALLAQIDAASINAKYGKYGLALDNLQNKFVPRTDGLALRGTPDTANGGDLDYYRGNSAVVLYTKAVSLNNELNWLQAHPS